MNKTNSSVLKAVSFISIPILKELLTLSSKLTVSKIVFFFPFPLFVSCSSPKKKMLRFVVFMSVLLLLAVSIESALGTPAAIMIAQGSSIIGYDSCGTQVSTLDAPFAVSNLHVVSNKLYYEVAGGDLYTLDPGSNSSDLWCSTCLPSGLWTISGTTIIGYGSTITTRAVNSSVETTVYTPASGSTIQSLVVGGNFAYWIEETSTGSSIWAAVFPTFATPTSLQDYTIKLRGIAATNNVVMITQGLEGKIDAFEQIISLPTTINVRDFTNALGSNIGEIDYLDEAETMITLYSVGGRSNLGSFSRNGGCINVVVENLPVDTTYIAGFGSQYTTCGTLQCYVPQGTTTADSAGESLIPSLLALVCAILVVSVTFIF